MMSKKEERESMREFNKRPGEKEKLKAIREKSRKMVHGHALIRGPHKGLVKGTKKHSMKHSKEDLHHAHKHMMEHMR